MMEKINTLHGEEWRPIPGFGSKYLISNQGRLYSNVRKCFKKFTVDPFGYHRINLRTLDDRSKGFGCHALVLMAFDRLKNQGEICRHLDGDRANNHISNLKWGTDLENAADRLVHGRQKFGDEHHTKKITSDIAKEIAQAVGGDIAIARKYGIGPSTVYAIRKGITWSEATGIPKSKQTQRRKDPMRLISGE